MLQVDPKFTFWFGVWTTVLLLIATYGLDQAPVAIAAYAPTVQWIAGFLFKVNSVILTALTGVSSMKSGPLIGVGLPSVPPAVKGAVLFFLATSLLLGLADPAQAQSQLKKPQITGNVVEDARANLGIGDQPAKLTGNIEKDAKAVWDKIVKASIADLEYASKMADSANTSASKVRKQCWDAIIAANKQANGLNLVDANGQPLAKPDPQFFTGVESLAETIDNLSPQGPLFTSCAGAAQLAKTNVLTLINAVVTGAAGFAAMPVIPGL